MTLDSLGDKVQRCGACGVMIKRSCIEDIAIYYDIKQDEARLYFYIDGSSGYALDEWTIPDAIAYHDTPEAAVERDIAVREAWGYYD